MKILVFIKEVPDIRIPLVCHEHTGRLRTEWSVPMLNPADQSAMRAALKLKKNLPGSHITLIHLGPPSGERWIREGLALGCDEGVRVWDEGLDGIDANGKALIFARMARILEFDCILTGARSLDTGSGQMGALLASRLDLPYIGSAEEFEVGVQKRSVIALKRLARGYHERIETPIPLVVAMEASSEPPGDSPLPPLLDAIEKAIPCFDCADLGIPLSLLHREKALLSYGPLRFPKARLKRTPAPDSSLPAFMRIQKLIEGTVTGREGRIIAGEEDHVVEELFQTLLREGWLNHLRKSD